MDILQRGALIGMHLAPNDEMIVNIALHLRRALLAPKDDAEGPTLYASSPRPTPPDSDPLCVLLLTDDGNMIQAALAAGVPACDYASFNSRLMAQHPSFFEAPDRTVSRCTAQRLRKKGRLARWHPHTSLRATRNSGRRPGTAQQTLPITNRCRSELPSPPAKKPVTGRA